MSEKIREHGLGFLASLRKTESKGILIQKLRAGDVIAIETKNSEYILRVLDPKKRKVEITKIKGKGKYFRKPTVTCVEGSCFMIIGGVIRVGWIGVGYRLKLTSGNIILTVAQRISVNGVQILPPIDEKGN